MAAAADVMLSMVVMLLYVLTEKELNGKPEAKKMTSCHTFGCFPWRPDKSSGKSKLAEKWTSSLSWRIRHTLSFLLIHEQDNH